MTKPATGKPSILERIKAGRTRDELIEDAILAACLGAALLFLAWLQGPVGWLVDQLGWFS